MGDRGCQLAHRRDAIDVGELGPCGVQCRLRVFGRSYVHHRPDNFLIACLTLHTMRSNLKIFHESILQEQTQLDVEVVGALRHAIDFVPHEFAVVRMNAFKQQVDRRLDRTGDFKYPIGFLRPDTSPLATLQPKLPMTLSR